MLVVELLQYLGPNRRSEHTVVEWKLEFSPAEIQAAERAAETHYSQLRQMLHESGIEQLSILAAEKSDRSGSAATDLPTWRNSSIADFLDFVARIALALQRSAGHSVEFHDLHPCKSPLQMRMIYESEHADVAINAGELALRLCQESIPGLEWQADPILWE